jgi:calcineurin-like phosphoesterase family protein
MTNDEYNNMIINNWNNTVNKNDIIYVLGGFGIGDCYDNILMLNGEVHFLNSVFTKSDSIFLDSIKNCVEHSVNKELKKRVFFETDQILVIPEVDCVLSYFPLNDWIGKTTNTFCFHGYTNNHFLKENNISCKFDLWDKCPVNINEVKKNFLIFDKLLSK